MPRRLRPGEEIRVLAISTQMYLSVSHHAHHIHTNDPSPASLRSPELGDSDPTPSLRVSSGSHASPYLAGRLGRDAVARKVRPCFSPRSTALEPAGRLSSAQESGS